MERTSFKLMGFAAILAVVLGAAFGIGRMVGPLDVGVETHDMAPASDMNATTGTKAAVAPNVSRAANVDGYTVTLEGDLRPRSTSELTMRVSKDSRPVTNLEPYLGAYGHLVILRVGDLAYLPVEPDTMSEESTVSGPAVPFGVEVPSDGTYRLFFDFRHDGQVHTAEFTAVASPQGENTDPADMAPTTEDHDGH